MSNVKIFGLGGLEEYGKNLYCVEVQDKIFVLDAGLKFPEVELYGIDYILPDFSYLVENKERIAGLFLTHGHEDQIGAVSHILNEIQINVYASKFTLEVLKETLKDFGLNPDEHKLYEITEFKTLKFDETIVSFFKLTHDIPDNLAIAIHTEDGVIVYATDFTFSQIASKKYKTSFNKISDISKKGVLALLVESYGIFSAGSGQYNDQFLYKLNNVFKVAEGRIIFSLYSTNLKRLQQVIDMSVKYHKKVAIIGRRTQRLISIAMDNGFLNIPDDILKNLKFIDDKNGNIEDDLVCFVTGERHEPYFMLQRMCKKIDKLIHINNRDTVAILTKPLMGTERMAAKTLDELHKTDANVITFSSDLLQESHPNIDEVKMMTNMLNPKYIFPIKGEYREMLKLLDVVKELGYTKDNTILQGNGEVAVIKDGKHVKSTERVKCSEILIDGKLTEDIGEAVLKDRELLGEDGLLLAIVLVNARTKKIVSGPKIISKGFIYFNEENELLDRITETTTDSVEEYLRHTQRIDWKELKKQMRNDVKGFIRKETNRSPIVMTVALNSEK